jgi:hypothetical protein
MAEASSSGWTTESSFIQVGMHGGRELGILAILLDKSWV